ncbi:MAG: phosphoglucosamine mutase [Pseudomonadota bacterium]
MTQPKARFGTDGIRGKAGTPPITIPVARRLGQCVGTILAANTDASSLVLIGRDTRASGPEFEAAIADGLNSVGIDAGLLGVAPTPAVASLVAQGPARAGIVISASHNPFEDNGFKLFDDQGCKLGAETEAQIEAALNADVPPLAAPKAGVRRPMDDLRSVYAAMLKDSLGADTSFAGLRIVLDAANGAAYEIAPQVLRDLGADLSVIGADPDGKNINKNCGSTHTAALKVAVRSMGAQIGIALDGDADRCLLVDEAGHEIDGDQILAALARDMAANAALKGGGLVSTVMSNLGLERHLEAAGLSLVRTPVGDKHVARAMRAGGFNLGGEPSGHIILSDQGPSGDGLLAAIRCVQAMLRQDAPASEAFNVFPPLPQVLINVRYGAADPLQTRAVTDAVAAAETSLGTRGRLLVRKSGTEPLIRVMVEAEDRALAEATAERLAAAIRSVG